MDAQLVQTHGAAGTRVARRRLQPPPGAPAQGPARDPFDEQPRVS